MSLLSEVKTGKTMPPLFFCVYGKAGIGKTTFASKAPRPIHLETEDGSNSLDNSSLKIRNFQHLLDVISELVDDKHEYKTIVIDSLDQLEIMVHDVVAKENNKKDIEQIPYKQGYIFAIAHWRKLFTYLSFAREQKKMNVILISHSHVKKINDPEVEPFDAHELKLHHKTGAFITEQVDALFFINDKKIIKENGRAVGSGERVLHVSPRPAFVAKNRYNLEGKMPLEWNNLISEIKTNYNKGDKK